MKRELSLSNKLSIFILYSIISLSVYELLAEALEPYFTHVIHYHTGKYTALLLIIFTLPMFIMTRTIALPYRLMGFNLDNWKKTVIEALVVSIVFCILITLLLLFLINYFEVFKSTPMLRVYEHPSTLKLILMPIIYIAFTPLQAFLIHSTIQAPLIYLLDIKYKGVFSIIITVLVFANFHLDLGLAFAIFVIPPTLLWCILFVRHQSLLGVYISHSIIGVWGLFILSYIDVIRVLEDCLQLQ